MSALAGDDRAEVFVPDAKPVRRFVAAIALVALALGALWWSGALAPRLTAACRERTGSRCGSARSCPIARGARLWERPRPDRPSW